MSKPIIHAMSSAKRYGGKPEEYLELHQHMDSTKGSFSDVRHRMMTHNSTYINNVIELIFGVSFINSVGRVVSYKQLAEDHTSEDFGGKFIPTLQDWCENLEFQDWMLNGKGQPPNSYRKLSDLEQRNKTTRTIKFDRD